jgi:hypothetical protein
MFIGGWCRITSGDYGPGELFWPEIRLEGTLLFPWCVGGRREEGRREREEGGDSSLVVGVE